MGVEVSRDCGGAGRAACGASGGPNQGSVASLPVGDVQDGIKAAALWPTNGGSAAPNPWTLACTSLHQPGFWPSNPRCVGCKWSQPVS